MRKYNVILFSDVPFSKYFSRNFGMHRLATELRDNGYTVLCVNYISSLSFDEYTRLIDLAVGPETYVVGLSTTWMPYRIAGAKNNNRSIVSQKIFSTEYTEEEHPWFFNSMGHKLPNEDSAPWLDYVKAKNSKIKIVAGGPKAGLYLDIPQIDNIIIGAGETQLLDYVNALSGKGMKRIFNRVIDYDRDAQNPTWNFQTSTTAYIQEDLLRSTEFINIEFSRGCMFNCAFCGYSMIGQTSARDILKYKETIKQEFVDNYEKWGVTKYLIVDHTFNDSTFKLEVIKEIVDTLPFKPKFWANIRVDLFAAHPEQAQLLLDIGVKEILFGLETLNEVTGKIINKAHRKNSIKGLRIAKSVWKDEVFIFASMICGLPKENVSSIEDTLAWYETEGHTLIDNLGYSPLTLVTSAIDGSLTDTSAIDKDMSKFNYVLDPTKSDPLNWTKEDGSDIVSREQAVELINTFRDKLNKLNKPDCMQFWLSGYEAIDASYSWESLKNPDHTKRPTQELYREYTSTLYWPKLFEILERG